MTADPTAFLLAYFLDEADPDGEAVRFAVSDDDTPYRFTPLHGGAPALSSAVGEHGARDPFLLRMPDGEVVLLATDLRTWPDHDWDRAVRHGSRGLLVSRSRDLLHWDDFHLVGVVPAGAGNVWAPKAFLDHGRWSVFWASALFAPGEDRTAGQYQRILTATTEDFRRFSLPEVYLDRGWDTIDTTFLSHDDRWYRFTVDQRVPGGTPELGHHPFEEVGVGLHDPDYQPLTDDVGKTAMRRGEGPAVAVSPTGDRWYLLIDEYGLRGYQLFQTDDLTSGTWQHQPDARLPDGARHGSLLPITAAERARLLDHDQRAEPGTAS